MKPLSLICMLLTAICLSVFGTAHADTMAIRDLVRGGGPLNNADTMANSLVGQVTDPNSMADPTAVRNTWNSTFGTTAATASRAALNVPFTTAKPPKPGLWSTIRDIIRRAFSLFSGTSGTSSTNMDVGAAHGVALADAAFYTIGATTSPPGGTFPLPYTFVGFSDAFGSAVVARYSFDVGITSDISNIVGNPFLSNGLGFVTAEQIINLETDFGFPVPQYQILTFENVPSGVGVVTFTAHIEGWAAVPEPSISLLLVTSLLGLVGYSWRRKAQRT